MLNESIELRAVVLDLDGLMVNSEDLYEQAGEIVLGRRGKTYDAPLRQQIMGRPAADALRIMIDCHSLPDPLDNLIDECRDVLEKLLATSLAAMPGLHELLDDLRAADVPVAVATSSTRDYADYTLGQLGLRDRFRFVLTAEDVRRGKPDPEIYMMAAEQFHISPPQMMVLEDSENGCRAAVAAGAFTVAVPNHHTHRHDFTGVEFVAHTLTDPRIRQALRLR